MGKSIFKNNAKNFIMCDKKYQGVVTIGDRLKPKETEVKKASTTAVDIKDTTKK